MADNEKKYSNIDLSVYDNGFVRSDALTQAGTLKQNAVDAYQNFANAGFSSEKQGMADSYLNQYLNRDKFSYDFNADALYQQYKDKYIQQGKMAMQDTMGQAAAMTGGYGNSYAASVGNQAYQAHLQNLNDVIPELYQMAYDKYNQEGQDMLNKYSLLGNAIDREYGMWNDTLGRLMADRDYYGQEESNLYNREYGAWDDNRTYDQTQYWKETEYGYGKDQDALAQALAEREMLIKEAQLRMQQEAWDLEKKEYESGGSGSGSGTGSGGGSGGGNGGGGGNDTTTPKEDVITVDDIKGDLNNIIKNAKDKNKAKSEVKNYLREALKARYITQSQYNSLFNTFAPRGNTY